MTKLSTLKPAGERARSTVCAVTGRTCAEAERFAGQLANSISVVLPFVRPTFEFAGYGRLEGCAAGCGSRFVADRKRVRLFCGVEADSDACTLADLADATFAEDVAAAARLARKSAGDRVAPCTIVECSVSQTDEVRGLERYS